MNLFPRSRDARIATGLLVSILVLGAVGVIQFATDPSNQEYCNPYPVQNLGSLPNMPVQSPVDTAKAYFNAMNHHDVVQLAALTAPGSERHTLIGLGCDLVTSNLNCHEVVSPGFIGAPALPPGYTSVMLSCSFYMPLEQANLNLGKGQKETGVQLIRKPPGPWLIYGTGSGG